MPSPAGPPNPGPQSQASTRWPEQPAYGEGVSDGGYAPVIRADRAPASAPPRPSAAGRQARGNQPSGPQPLTGSAGPAYIYSEPAAPGALARDPDVPYGPDDPAYGPPSPEWYARDAQAREAEDGGPQDARGPFEPIRHPGASGQELAHQPAGYAPAGAGDDDPIGGTKVLDQIKDFYLTAEAIGPENLDRHIAELLERQRQLISEYFKEAGLQENPR
jgi:hypothetical protein